MSKQLQIKTSPDTSRPLGKEQKRFNNYVSRIQQLRADIERTKAQDPELRRIGDERVTPVEKEAMAALRVQIFALDDIPHLGSLLEKQAEKFRNIMVSEIACSLQTAFYKEDEALKSLYEKYCADAQSRDSAITMEQGDMKGMASRFFNQMFRTNFDAEDCDDPVK